MTQVIQHFSGKYAFLSNFYPSEIKYKGIWYATLEAAFQAQKTHDEGMRVYISLLSEPAEAKAEGQKVKLRSDWEKVKCNIMLDLVRKKFKEDIVLKKRLLRTGDALLVEGNNWHDNIWGDCYCSKCKNIPGQNELGSILMLVRRELKEEDNAN